MAHTSAHRTAAALVARARMGAARRRGGVTDSALSVALALALGAWLTFLFLPAHLRQGSLTDAWPLMPALLLQIALLASEAALLLGAGLWRMNGRAAWCAHAGLSMLCLAAALMGTGLPLTPLAWMVLNSGFVLTMVVLLGAHAWREGSGIAWVAVLAAVPVFALALNEKALLFFGEVELSALQWVVVLELGLVWLALPRLATSNASARSDDERRRQLAQDLHDGVGSHLTSLIAALERGTPAQRETSTALQHCLLELKLLVDGAHDEGSVVSHLANLRYRVQPLLDVAGITMHWQLVPSEPLERVCGDDATQVLRIAQEALANVVRHSAARTVTVHCSAVLSPPGGLLLEIRDDGRGWLERVSTHHDGGFTARPRTRGRGLASMRARAARLGGSVLIESVAGGGTCVRLQVPMAALPGRRFRR